MPIREERDPAFWERIAKHPACAAALMGVEPAAFAAAAVQEPLLPLAAEHGGFVFAPRDAFARVVELHTLFTPEGWGREVLEAAAEAFERVFERFDLTITYENMADWRSRPPRSFGFRPCGEAFEVNGTQFKLWRMSRKDWRGSPAYKRRHGCR